MLYCIGVKIVMNYLENNLSGVIDMSGVCSWCDRYEWGVQLWIGDPYP